jgi:hypothetical protein
MEKVVQVVPEVWPLWIEMGCVLHPAAGVNYIRVMRRNYAGSTYYFEVVTPKDKLLYGSEMDIPPIYLRIFQTHLGSLLMPIRERESLGV